MLKISSKFSKQGKSKSSLLIAFAVLGVIGMEGIHGAVPLTATGGRTNHPVLFVHGHAAHMTTEWGAIPTPPAGGGCNLAENPVTWQVDKNISHRRSWGIPYYKHGVLVRAFMRDCGDSLRQIFPTPKPNDSLLSLGRSGWISCNSEVWWGSWSDCAQPLRGNTTAYHDGDAVYGTFHLDGQGSNFEDFSKTYSLNKDQQKLMENARDEFVRANSGGVVFDDGTVAYPLTSENFLDRPLAYLPSSTPRQLQTALSLNAPPTENGLYFFNAKRITGSLVTVSPLQPVPWNQAWSSRPGQSQQLYQRIVQVMDDFYTPQGIDWRISTTATLDLIGYSQGGLTIRTMIDQLQNHPNDLDAEGQPFRVVLNRINRVVALDAPNLGAALITDPARLTNGTSHPQSPEPLQFPVLGREILNLTEQDPGFPVLAVHDNDIIDVNYWDNPGLHLEVQGDSYLGRYTQTEGRATIFGCSVNCSWVDCTLNIPSALVCWQTLEFPLPITEMLDVLSQKTDSLKTMIRNMRASASHLTWSDATTSGIPTGQLIQDALDYSYPQTSAGVNIDMVNLHSPSAGALLTAIPDKIEKELYPICKEVMPEVLKQPEVDIPAFMKNQVNIGPTCARLADKMAGGLALREFAGEFDADWSVRSDFVVEDFSQQGILEGTDYNPLLNPKMKVESFTKPELIHYGVPFLEDHPRWVAHNQACDVLGALGGLCPSNPSPPPVTVEQSGLSLAPEGMDRLESKAVSGRGQGIYKVRLRYKRLAPGILNSLNLTYYFKEDPANQPGASVTTGSWSASVRQVEGALYAVDLTASGLNLAQGQTSGEVELAFSNGNGRIWDPVDDWSSALTPGWQATRRIARSPRPGESIGLIPPTGDPDNTTLGLSARVLSKERSWDVNQSQPNLSLENSGFGTLQGFTLWYVIRAPAPFQIRQYWRTGQAQSTITSEPLGNGYYAIKISYPTWVLHPGERIDEITFELNHLDWSAWNLGDDPSYHTQNPHDLLVNSKIMAFDMQNNLIGGEDLSPLWETGTGAAQAHVEAKNTSVYPDYKVLDFRIKNDGELPMYGLEMRYRMVTEGGSTPQVLIVNTLGCQTEVIDYGSGRHEARIQCPGASLEPGQVWPQPGADQGLRLEIQYGGGNPVDLTNDPSFSGMTSAWSPASGVLLYDMEEYGLSGYAPWP